MPCTTIFKLRKIKNDDNSIINKCRVENDGAGAQVNWSYTQESGSEYLFCRFNGASSTRAYDVHNNNDILWDVPNSSCSLIRTRACGSGVGVPPPLIVDRSHCGDVLKWHRFSVARPHLEGAVIPENTSIRRAENPHGGGVGGSCRETLLDIVNTRALAL